jgi:two-component sensor histidine kinase
MATPIPLNPAAAQGLGMALVAASAAPLLLLKADLTVVAASLSFTRAFQIDPAIVEGRKLYELGRGEWGDPQLRSLLSAAASGDAEVEGYEMDLKLGLAPLCRLLLHARRLHYGDASSVRLLVTVTDITEARRNAASLDDLLREKAALLDGVGPRVANSLQVIASLLMLSARRVQADAARHHLYDANNRAMDVAALQKQLADSAIGDVELRPYFTNLCLSLAASMIPDPNRLALVVTVDGSVVAADVSIALGLIVTELVINAIRHAFPVHRSGKIFVDYRSRGRTWTLSVRDDGIGMSAAPALGRAGLGTRIVDALAKHLHAIVQVEDRGPGMAVSVVSAPALRLVAVGPAQP